MNQCYIIVHPFFSVKEDGSLISYVEPEKHGDYEPYQKNLEQLIDSLTEKKEFTIFALEDSPTGEVKEAISKNKNAVIWETEFHDGKFKYNDVSSLKAEGIKQVFIAGEWVWWHGAGCLGKVYDNLKVNFLKVKGVKGCVYPSKSCFRFSTFYRGLVD